jgi:hypothetical protein
MGRKLLRSTVLAVALTAALGGCYSPEVAGPVTRSHCARTYHDEGFPNDPNPWRAYGCKSDSSGYIRRDNIDPLTP